ncbi:MAG: N-acetyltransferase [Lachnospiraceae bacterium]|nr:N-acetyltransferase [Lachnospiraceae bacterium]
MNNIEHRTFAEIDLQDPFFQSLRDDYDGFDDWFGRKHDQDAFVQYDDNHEIIGFLYLKVEENLVDDIVPNIQAKKILKVGTFKIEAHGTKMGEQFIKIISDYAVSEQVDVCYVTIFDKHASLINLVQQFGFNFYGTKENGSKKENVYLKHMKMTTGNINKDFPLVNSCHANKYLLSIYPKYHSVMFPDSILTTENKKIIKDVSYTNSIHKIYVCTMSQVEDFKYGDIVVVYRTAEYGKNAEYSSVATSICVVEEVKKQSEFSSFDKFYEYACKYSVFDRDDLRKWYNKGGCKAIKMTYNGAFKKRIVRHELAEKIGLDRDEYWGCMKLTDDQFRQIVTIGDVAGLIC